jgi:hypothetical protein
VKVCVPTTKLPCELAVTVWPFMIREGAMVVVTAAVLGGATPGREIAVPDIVMAGAPAVNV